MKLAVTMIVLNNEDTLLACLKSLHGLANHVTIVDGGSQDETLNIIHRQKGILNIKLVEHKWPGHFALQRQVSFDHAPRGEEWWWMRIDSDEIFPARYKSWFRQALRNLPPEIVAVRVKQYNIVSDKSHYAASHGGWETWPRVWRADERLRWVGQVHEHVMKLSGGQLIEFLDDEIADFNVGILHLGWLDEKRLAEKESQYLSMYGSGFEKPGDLTGRKYAVRRLPSCYVEEELLWQ